MMGRQDALTLGINQNQVIDMIVCCLVTMLAVPVDNPAANYGIEWVDQLPWKTVVNIADVQGDDLMKRVAKAQETLVAQGGGVLFFPAGSYSFDNHLMIRDGVLFRGETPEVRDAKREDYAPRTRFVFPKYQPTMKGNGTPIDSAFKGISLAEPRKASNTGIVHIAIDFGHIDFGEDDGHVCGKNRIVFGCVLRNAAVADPAVPDLKLGQKPWQRFNARHHAAVTVKGENVLIANNRLPKSGEANFTMRDYIVKGRGREPNLVTIPEVVFDYDNRPGLYVNDYGIGGPGGNPPDGTPETHPFGFRKGVEIRDNFIYCSGRCAISFTGDGTRCADNVVRFARDAYRPTATGRDLTAGSSTNDNRAVQMRGWRWVVSGNDYEVHRNWAADRKYRINDGEGLMHEDHVNSIVKDSKVINNRGNAYISIYKTGGIDGLLVEGNDIRTPGGISAIYVVADRNSGRHPCRNVSIVGNTTAGSGITIAGEPASGNVVKDNRHVGGNGKLTNDANAQVSGNQGYE